MRIAVFCSSSPTIDAKYQAVATELGNAIGNQGWGLVSGGGHISTMGAIGRAVREVGGHTIGVIPQSLVDIEFADHDSDELHVVESMRERKAKIEDLADAFITLPGGPGTLEEFFEVWTWRQLGYHNKPIGLLNLNDYYSPMLSFLNGVVTQEFMGSWQMDLIQSNSDYATLLPNLIQAAGLPTKFDSQAI
jgi:uncharacterized protein (TIGR00730 family)